MGWMDEIMDLVGFCADDETVGESPRPLLVTRLGVQGRQRVDPSSESHSATDGS